MTPCPSCGTDTVSHCGPKSTTCPWHTCQNRKCGAIVNFRRGRGYIVRNNVTTYLNFPPTAAVA